MLECVCPCCPTGKTPKKFLVTGLAGVSNNFCSNCEAFNRDWTLFHVAACEWHTCDLGPCTPAVTMVLACDGETWVLQMSALLSSASYTLAADEFNCLAANTMNLASEGDDCQGWPQTLTVTPVQE